MLQVILGPFLQEKVPGVHLNRFGVIPKLHQPGKWRLIVDLSHPEGRSVNDWIDSSLTSLHYVWLDDIANNCYSWGQVP